MKVSAIITLKKDVLDPQGTVIANSLKSLGYNNVDNVRQGKFIELEISSQDKETAIKQCNDMCKKLLANLVIEDYAVEIEK